jgi:hypothetical protein
VKIHGVMHPKVFRARGERPRRLHRGPVPAASADPWPQAEIDTRQGERDHRNLKD